MSALLPDGALTDSSIANKSKSPLLGALAIAVLAAVGLAILLVVPVPIKGRAVSAAMDLMHAPAFALLAWLTCQAVSKRLPTALWKKLLLVALPLAGCGLMAEVVQSFVGRGASWHDARANLCGALAGVFLFELWRNRASRLRWPWRVAICGLLALASLRPLAVLYDTWQQHQQFPLIASFEQPLETSRFIAQDSILTRIPISADQKNWGLQIDLQPGEFPGLMLDGMPGDWSGYSSLSFDLIVSEGPALNLIVKVTDREHPAHDYASDDRFDGHFQLAPGKHHIRIPLSEIRSAPRTREMDMTHIEGCQLFTYHLEEPRTIILDNLRLE